MTLNMIGLVIRQANASKQHIFKQVQHWNVSPILKHITTS